MPFGPGIPSYGALAADYARYRPSYPDTVYYRMREALAGRMNLALDVGAGTGQVSRSLCNWFDAVCAMEPDRALFDLIETSDVVTGCQCAAEDRDCPPKGADAVVCGSALHWLDVDAFVSNVISWLAPGGVLLVFGYGPPQYHGISKEAADLLKDHHGRWRAFMPDKLRDWAPYAKLLSATGRFASIESYECYAEHDWTMAELVGFSLTTSYGAAFSESQTDPVDYREQLTRALMAANHDKTVRVRFPIEVALARID